MDSRGKSVRGDQPCVLAMSHSGLAVLTYEGRGWGRAKILRVIYVTELFLIVSWFSPVGIRTYAVLIVSLGFLQMI